MHFINNFSSDPSFCNYVNAFVHPFKEVWRWPGCQDSVANSKLKLIFPCSETICFSTYLRLFGQVRSVELPLFGKDALPCPSLEGHFQNYTYFIFRCTSDEHFFNYSKKYLEEGVPRIVGLYLNMCSSDGLFLESLGDPYKILSFFLPLFFRFSMPFLGF